GWGSSPSPAPDWLTGPAQEAPLPPLPSAPEEPFAAFLTPVVRREPQRRESSRALWLVLLPAALFVLLAVTGAILVVSRSEKKPKADGSPSASATQPPTVESPRHKPPAEKKPEKPAEKPKPPSPEPPPEKAKPASP